MDDATEIVRYTPADRAEVFELLDRAHPAELSARLQRQWDWKYEANPFNRDGEPYLLLWRDGGQIVGMLGVMSVRMCIDGRERIVGHLCDWSMRPDHRGRRMARRLLDRQRPDWPVRFAWQNEISRRLSPGMIGDNSGILRLSPLTRVLAVGDVIADASGSRLAGRIASATTMSTCAFLRRLRDRTSVAGVTVEETCGFDDRFDELWQRARRDYRVLLVRDRRYLQWRFAERPDARYRILVAMRGGDLVGYLVFRELQQDDAGRGYLVDFMVADRSTAVFSQLLSLAIARLEHHGTRWLTCRVIVPPFRGVLYRHGFLPIRQSVGGYLRSYRPDADTSDMDSRTFVDPRNWFLTMGDGDLEISV
ncbi:MAG TPA: GNAT family N-acetyltransferase [Candidatus Binatia bacterium]|nr:GNAT family N-acetyltransferase [Candidatus Binatia bacterium]